MADRCPSNQAAISLPCPAGQRSAEIGGGGSRVDWRQLTCLIKVGVGFGPAASRGASRLWVGCGSKHVNAEMFRLCDKTKLLSVRSEGLIVIFHAARVLSHLRFGCDDALRVHAVLGGGRAIMRELCQEMCLG